MTASDSRAVVEADQPRELSASEFRDVIGHFASGVTVITAVHEGADFGTTASAVSSLSLEPPMLLVCLNMSSSTGRAIHDARRFAVNILGVDQPDVAMRFATKDPQKFDGVAIARGHGDVPLLEDALARVECRVVEEVTGGTHWVFLGEVDSASARPGAPLAYFRGEFGRLELAADDDALRLVREAIIGRALPIGEPIALDELAEQIGAPRGSVYHALTKLTQERVVTRDPAGAFVVRPMTLEIVMDAFRARTAIFLGAVELSVETAADEQIAELRLLLEALPGVAEGAEPDAYRTYLTAYQRFIEYVIGLASSTALLDTFQRFNMPALIAAQQAGGGPSTRLLLAAYNDLVDAYAARDLGRARAAVRSTIEPGFEWARWAFARHDEL